MKNDHNPSASKNHKCGDLLEEALLQNRDDAEDIVKYFSSLVSIYNFFILNEKLVHI